MASLLSVEVAQSLVGSSQWNHICKLSILRYSKCSFSRLSQQVFGIFDRAGGRVNAPVQDEQMHEDSLLIMSVVAVLGCDLPLRLECRSGRYECFFDASRLEFRPSQPPDGAHPARDREVIGTACSDHIVEQAHGITSQRNGRIRVGLA